MPRRKLAPVISLAEYRAARTAPAPVAAPLPDPEAIAADLIDQGMRFHEEERDLDMAERFYRAALAVFDDFTGWFNLGVCLDDAGRDHLAIHAYMSALSRSPKEPDAHFNLARVFERIGDRLAATRHLNTYRRLTRHAR